MDVILHILGLCPDSMSHIDLLDIHKFPIIELINFLRNGR
jgi:hypothetical protein